MRENIGVNARFASRDVEINFDKRFGVIAHVKRTVVSRVSSVKIIRNSRYGNGSRLSAYERVFGEFRRNRGFAVFFVSDHDVIVRNPEEDTAVLISRSRRRSLHQNIRREFSVCVRRYFKVKFIESGGFNGRLYRCFVQIFRVGFYVESNAASYRHDFGNVFFDVLFGYDGLGFAADKAKLHAVHEILSFRLGIGLGFTDNESFDISVFVRNQSGVDRKNLINVAFKGFYFARGFFKFRIGKSVSGGSYRVARIRPVSDYEFYFDFFEVLSLYLFRKFNREVLLVA